MISFTGKDSLFVGFVVEAILWGFYIPIFVVSMGSLLWSKKMGRSMNWFTLTAICLLFWLCTAHFALSFYHIYFGLLHRPTTKFLTSKISLDTLLSTIVLTTTDFIAQTVLVYRCWRMYEKNFLVVVLPVLISLISYGMGLTSAVIQIMVTEGEKEPEFIPILLGAMSFLLSLLLNVLVTGLVIYRIWVLARVARESDVYFKQSGLITAVEALVGSGVLFMLAQVTFVVLFVLKSDGELIAVSVAAQVYGIAPTLLIAHVAVGQAARKADPRSRLTMMSPTPLIDSKSDEWEKRSLGAYEYEEAPQAQA